MERGWEKIMVNPRVVHSFKHACIWRETCNCSFMFLICYFLKTEKSLEFGVKRSVLSLKETEPM